MLGRPSRPPRLAGRAPVLALAAVLVLAPAGARAQRVLGGGSDGVTLPRGALRVGLGGETTVQRDQWRDGRLEALGGPVTADAFGALQLSTLVPVEQLVRGLGVADFSASLGRSRLDARQRAFVTPLAVEYGVTDWLTLGARATLVRTKAEAQFRIRGDSGRATLGLNPILLGTGVAVQNATTIGAYANAASSLAARRTACQADAGAFPECPTILAELADVNALAARTSEFATGLTALYGAGIIGGRRFVPMVGSAAESTLVARVDSLRTALERYGVTEVTAGTGLPEGARLPVTATDLGRMVRDSTWGYGARTLNDAGLTQVGDVHVSAMLRLHDSFARRGASRFAADARGWRQAILVEGRIGTSYRERPDAFLDQGTGSGTSAVTLRSITDVVVNQRLWATVAVGYTKPFGETFRMRLPSDTGSGWLEWWREAEVPVTPGAQLDVEVSPRWHLNDYVALGAQWRWRSKAADRHDFTGTGTMPTGESVPLLGALLDDLTKADEQRFGWSATYSTLAARQRGTRGMAFEISFVHQQSVASGSGLVPKQWEDRLLLRYYARFLAR